MLQCMHNLCKAIITLASNIYITLYVRMGYAVFIIVALNRRRLTRKNWEIYYE